MLRLLYREFIQVLRLQVPRLMAEFHQHQVEQAVTDALRLRAIDKDMLAVI